MSKNKKNNKKIRNNYTLEALEPRLMMSADSAQAAAEEYINSYITSSEFIGDVVGNVNKLNQNEVKIDGTSLSISDLLDDKSFSLSGQDVKLAQEEGTDLYEVSLDKLNLNKNIEGLSVDVKGQTVSGLKASLSTSVKVDGLTLKITENDGDFAVNKANFGDVSLVSDIFID